MPSFLPQANFKSAGLCMSVHTTCCGMVPPCPQSHPQFMFELGDGQGGLMTREVFVPKKEKKQFVDHTGLERVQNTLVNLA